MSEKIVGVEKMLRVIIPDSAISYHLLFFQKRNPGPGDEVICGAGRSGKIGDDLWGNPNFEPAPPKNWVPECYKACNGNPLFAVGVCQQCPHRKRD